MTSGTGEEVRPVGLIMAATAKGLFSTQLGATQLDIYLIIIAQRLEREGIVYSA